MSRRSAIKIKHIEKSPYSYDQEKIRRYDQANQIFRRVAHDPTWDGYMRGQDEVGLRNIPENNLGYTWVDYALAKASWTTIEGFEEAWSWSRIPKPGGFSPMEEKWDKSKDKLEVIDSVEMTAQVKKAAKFYGADLVGVTSYNKIWMQKNKLSDLTPLELPGEVKWVVVCAVEMDELAMATSPMAPSGAAVGLGYSKMAFIASTLAEFIRNLGYTAIPAGNDVGLSIPIAIEAGLGQLGRNDSLITPEYGPRVRLVKVYTDLPLEPDEPIDFGVTEFCKTCKRCAEACEADAISFKDKPDWEPACKSNNPGVLRWSLNGEKCYEYWCDNGMICSNCISVCPFTKGRTEVAPEKFWKI